MESPEAMSMRKRCVGRKCASKRRRKTVAVRMERIRERGGWSGWRIGEGDESEFFRGRGRRAAMGFSAGGPRLMAEDAEGRVLEVADVAEEFMLSHCPIA